MGTIFKVSVYSEKSLNKVENIVEESFKIANEMDDFLTIRQKVKFQNLMNKGAVYHLKLAVIY